MSNTNRELIFADIFLDDLISLENYIGRNSAKKEEFLHQKYMTILLM